MRESRFVNASRSPLPRLVCLLLGLLALPSPAAEKPTVAVLYFDYAGQTEEMTPLRKGLAQMLITDLSGLDSSVRFVERERLQAIIDELDLGKSTRFDQDTVVKIGNLLGAHYLVVGSYLDFMGQLRLNARVLQVKTSLVRGVSVLGRPEDFFTLEQDLARDLARLLGEFTAADAEPSKTPAIPVKKPGKLTTKTALRYARALDAKDRKDLETAKKELTAVVKEQPDFQLASAELALMMK